MTSQLAIRWSRLLGLIWIAIFWVVVIAIAPPAFIIALVYLARNAGPTVKRRRTSHGTAEWATKRELLNRGMLFARSGLTLGLLPLTDKLNLWERLRILLSLQIASSDAVRLTNKGEFADPLIEVSEASPHLCVFGASGSGKSTSFAIPWLFQLSDGCLICTDPKGELSRKTAAYRRDTLGHRVVIFDPYNVSNCGIEPSRINPLDAFRQNEALMVDEARRISVAMIATTGREAERFWSDSAISAVTAVVAFLLAIAKDGATLNHLRDVLTNDQLLTQAMQMMSESERCHGLLGRLAGEFNTLEGKVRASVLAVVNSNLSFLDSVAVGTALSDSDIDPRELIADQTTVFLCIPIDRLKELAPLQRLMITTIINLVFAAGESSRRRVNLLLDEAASLSGGGMDALYNAIQFGRGYGLRVFQLYQSVSQLEQNFPESRKSDVLATVTKIFAGTDDLETARFVSDSCGQSTILSHTSQEGVSKARTNSTGIHDQTTSVNWGDNDSSSFAEQGRPLLTQAEAMTLPRNLGVAFVPGMSPILFRKRPHYGIRQMSKWRRSGRGLGAVLMIGFTAITFSLLSMQMWKDAGPEEVMNWLAALRNLLWKSFMSLSAHR